MKTKRLLLIGFVLIKLNASGDWHQTNGPFGGSVACFAFNGPYVFAGLGDYSWDNGGIFRSSNNGDSWTEVNNGLPNCSVYSMVVNGSTIFAGTQMGVYRSDDNGDNWFASNNGLDTLNNNFMFNSMLVDGTDIYAGTRFRGMYKSTDNGNSWFSTNNGLDTVYAVTCIIAVGSNIFANVDGVGDGVFLSTNHGGSWTLVNNGIPINRINTMASCGSYIFAGDCLGHGIYRSNNNGASWTTANTGLNLLCIYSMAVCSIGIYVSTQSGVYFSSDTGSTWTSIGVTGLSNEQYSLAVNGSHIFAGTNYLAAVSTPTYRGIFYSDNFGLTWTNKSNGLLGSRIETLVVRGDSIFAGTRGEGLFLSLDNGMQWTKIDSGMNNGTVTSLLFYGNKIFASTFNGIYKSVNNAVSWTPVPSPPMHEVRKLAALGANIFAGTYYDGIFASTDSGATWASSNNGIDVVADTSDLYVTSFIVTGSYVLAGTFGDGIFKSTNNGASWTNISPGIQYTNSMVSIGSKIFAAEAGGVDVSVDNGFSWTFYTSGFSQSEDVLSLAVKDTVLIAGTHDWSNINGGVYLSYNYGSSWTPVNTGLSYKYINTVAVHRNDIFAGTNYKGVWEYPCAFNVPATGNIHGTSLIVPGVNGIHYSVSPVTDALSYQWTVPANASIVSGQGTPAIVVNFGSNFIGGNITVSDSSSCGISTATSRRVRSVIVNHLPSSSPSHLRLVSNGDEDESEEEIIDLNIFPMPVKNNLTVEYGEPLSYVQLFDVTGKLILFETLDASSADLDLSNLNNGIYFLTAVSGEKQFHRKIIKE